MVGLGDGDPAAASGGTFRLRHTFAIRQLKYHRSDEDVARWMGIVNKEDLERYKAAMDNCEEVV